MTTASRKRRRDTTNRSRRNHRRRRVRVSNRPTRPAQWTKSSKACTKLSGVRHRSGTAKQPRADNVRANDRPMPSCRPSQPTRRIRWPSRRTTQPKVARAPNADGIALGRPTDTLAADLTQSHGTKWAAIEPLCRLHWTRIANGRTVFFFFLEFSCADPLTGTSEQSLAAAWRHHQKRDAHQRCLSASPDARHREADPARGAPHRPSKVKILSL